MFSDTKYPIMSEDIEPAMAHIIGRLYAQVKEAQTREPEEPWQEGLRADAVEDACLNLWLATKAINRLSTTCSQKRPGAIHFSLVSGNIMSLIDTYIKEILGFSPWFDKEHQTAKRWNAI